MERKIGEIFEYNGEWYQCIIGHCNQCSFDEAGTCKFIGYPYCAYRNDNKLACFKKLEKVGEPYTTFVDKTVQNYLLETVVSVPPKNVFVLINNEQRLIAIEIKQNKEDMEEKKIQHYDCFFDKEQSKPNLKPFSLEAAKAGKPVCTRDGRKARIICFDADGNKPLIVLSKIDGKEIILRYTEKGQSDNFHSPTPRKDDLMMLPEKKEGWINIYNADTTFYYADGRVFETKDEAVQEAKEEVEKEQREKNEYIDTIRVEWEE